MPISRARGIVRLAAIPLLVGLASIPAAEGVFRALGDRPAADLQGLYTSFGEGNFRHGPWVDTNCDWASGRFSVHTDSLGLRCDAPRRRASAAGTTIDVLVLGDSQGFGLGLDYETSLVGALAGDAAAGGLRLGNASVGGHYLANQYELARWLHDEQRLKPRQYVLLLSPYLIKTAGALNKVTVGQDGRLYRGAVDRKRAVLGWIKTRAVLFARVRNAVRALGIGAADLEAVDIVTLYRDAKNPELAAEKLVASLRQFRELARADGADLLLAYTPLAMELGFDPVRRAAAERGDRVDPDLPFRLAAAAATELGLEMFDLRPNLARIRAEGRPLSLKGDPHYCAATSRACAASLWAALQAWRGRPAPPPPAAG